MIWSLTTNQPILQQQQYSAERWTFFSYTTNGNKSASHIHIIATHRVLQQMSHLGESHISILCIVQYRSADGVHHIPKDKEIRKYFGNK